MVNQTRRVRAWLLQRRSRVDSAEADRQAPRIRVHVQGNPVEQLSTAAWYKALQRAGIQNFRWHDLRHTWASWHVQSGTPLHVLQELGGWASFAMVQRYAHLAADHLAPWADRLLALRAERGIAVAARRAASGFALRALPRRKTSTTSWDINRSPALQQRLGLRDQRIHHSAEHL